MGVRLYVGHEVISRKMFLKLKYENNTMSCQFSNRYFISRKCVLLQRDRNGNYIYIKNNSKSNVIDPNSLEVSIDNYNCTVVDPNNLEIVVNMLACNQCDKKGSNGIDCEISADAPDEFLGILDIQPIESFARTTDVFLAMNLVKEYNMSIDKDNEYVPVDDLHYTDTIREIDDGIGRKRIRGIKKESDK